jgi:hypothetical protein
MQLQLVSSIIDANRVALLAAGGIPGPLGTIEMPHRFYRDAYYAAPIVRKRDYIYQPPKVLPRETIRLEPNVTTLPVPPVDACAAPTSKPMDLKNPIQPPWAVLPYPKPLQSMQKVKTAPDANDVSSKGTLLDCFM